MGTLSIVMLVMLLLVSSAFAENYVVVNSYDGRDVLSAIFYANAKGLPVRFMPTQGIASADLLATKVGAGHDVLLVQSSSLPISGFVKTALESNNNSVEVYSSADGGETNIELALRSGAKKFIIVDSAYSDSALSVMAYAARTNSYVLMADKANIGNVAEALTGAESVIIFGLVDIEVKEALMKFDPEIIGNGEDRYEDNVLMLEKMMDEFPDVKMVIADRGVYLEEGMAEGKYPVMLTGRIVPRATRDFIEENVRSGQLKIIMLFGNELVVPMYDLRNDIKQEIEADTGVEPSLGIMLKFGQAIPSAGTDVLSLDKFALPAYIPSLRVDEIAYNVDSKTVMVTVENTGEGSAYFSNELRVSVDGADYLVLSDDAPQLIERGEKLGTEYSVDLSGVTEGEINATVVTRYGYSRNVLDSWDSLSGPLTEISYTDISDLLVQSASYDSENGRLLITVRNNGDDGAYFKNAVELVLGGQPTTVRGTAQSIEGASMMVDELPLVLSDDDFSANPTITVEMNYGAREGFLTKSSSYTLPLEKAEVFPVLLIAVVVVVLLVVALAVFFFFMKKGRKSEGG
ncbi:TPA: hypothetical protein EYP38_01910 [Candidatus Micrarchaeota archaeon]|nr:hypothetical protein [Candidatus Micrarchaeota archaeon]